MTRLKMLPWLLLLVGPVSSPLEAQTLFLNQSLAARSQVGTGSSTVDNVLFGTRSVSTPSAGYLSRSTSATGGLFGTAGTTPSGGFSGTFDSTTGGLGGSTVGVTGGSSGSTYGTTGGLVDTDRQSVSGGALAVTSSDLPQTSTGGTNIAPLTSQDQ